MEYMELLLEKTFVIFERLSIKGFESTGCWCSIKLKTIQETEL